MKILLINSNPVVSRLTALSARKEEIQIDEVQEVNEVNNGHYDIVFVDADSWNKEVDSVISKNIQTQKRVLFYAQDDKESTDEFDISILKPFLPSEVSAVIRLVEESSLSVDNSIESKSIEKPVIVAIPEDKPKDEFLQSLNDDLDFEEKEKPLETKVVVEPKDNRDEDIFAELKDDSKTFDQELEDAFPFKKTELENDSLFDLDLESNTKKEEASLIALEKDTKRDDLNVENSELFDFDLDSSDELDLNLDVLSEDKPKETPKQETKVMKKEEAKVLDIQNEPSLEILDQELTVSETKVETKILDETELSTIKDILNNDSKTDGKLEDLMSNQGVASPVVDLSKKEKKGKSKKIKVSSGIGSEMLAETLVALPIETLRGLLAGARIKISIKFPKDK